jgi:hypothetical protein
VTKRTPKIANRPSEAATAVGAYGNKEAKPLAKSSDPAYTKFTIYIKKTTHLGVKTRLVSKGKELSDLVEELLAKWLKENESFEA